MMRKITAATVVSIGLSTAADAEPVALKFSNDWQSEAVVYLFLPTSTSGTSTVAGQPVPVDLDLRDALELLDFAVAGRFESWRGNFGLVADLNYLSLKADSRLPGPVGASVNVDVKQYWLGFLGAYRVASGTTSTSGRRYSIDLQAGARYNSLKQEVSIAGPGPGVTLGGTETWWEPVIGARAVWEINDRWTGVLMADAGGFGAGGNDLQWSATLGFDYGINESSAIKMGLRYYSIDFSATRSDGEFAYDVDQVGPFIGYAYKF